MLFWLMHISIIWIIQFWFLSHLMIFFSESSVLDAVNIYIIFLNLNEFM